MAVNFKWIVTLKTRKFASKCKTGDAAARDYLAGSQFHFYRQCRDSVLLLLQLDDKCVYTEITVECIIILRYSPGVSGEFFSVSHIPAEYWNNMNSNIFNTLVWKNKIKRLLDIPLPYSVWLSNIFLLFISWLWNIFSFYWAEHGTMMNSRSQGSNLGQVFQIIQSSA